MTLTIDIPPDLEGRLRKEAERRGVVAEELACKFLEERLPTPAETPLWTHSILTSSGVIQEANFRSTKRNIKIKNIEEAKAEFRKGTGGSIEEIQANMKKVDESVKRLIEFVENRPGKLFPETKRSR